MTSIRDVFSANLKKFRLARGWSQACLAEKAGTSTNYIGNMENAIKFPSSEMVDKLALSLEIDPTELFSKEIDPETTMKVYEREAYHSVSNAITGIINTNILRLDKQIGKKKKK